MKKFPWFNNYKEIEKRKYNLKPIPDSSWFLLTPAANKFEWDYDKKDPYGELSELSWRSSILDENGFEISGGLPKFYNWGENRDENGSYSYIDKKIAEDISNHKAIITKKEDGSLIIRSVYNNQVLFRTRGYHELPENIGEINFKEIVMKIINDKYPILLDPKILKDVDVMFEFISPENKIIIKYDTRDLILLAIKDKNSHKILPRKLLEEIAASYNLNIVEVMFDFEKCSSPQDIKNLIDEMEINKTWQNEGVVIQSSDGFLVKIKGQQYLSLHKMKSNFNYIKMVEICEENYINNLEELKKYLKNILNLDWEDIYDIKYMFDLYIQRKNYFLSILDEIEFFVNNWKPQNNNNVQKQFATQVKNKSYSDIYFALFNYSSDSQKLNKSISKLFDKIVKEK